MDKMVIALCGIWFWLTRAWRVDTYCAAAETLELAHAYLLRDFAARASTRDRGILLPQHHEALSILQRHAIDTYVTATRFAKLRDCCRFVAEEMRALAAPAPAPVARPAVAVLRPVSALSRLRIRFANRVLQFALPASTRLRGFAHFLSAETWGCIWDRVSVGSWSLRPVADSALTAEPAKQPLKAA
jgi:hypothetical protein